MERLKLSNYNKATLHLQTYQDNVLFALAVTTRKCSGFIYTDSNENPQTFYIVSKYGMSEKQIIKTSTNNSLLT